MTSVHDATRHPRPAPVAGRRGMVATSQPLATLAAVDILRGGGSAVDAAIAANAVLAVTEPHMCGPGGDLFALVWDPAKRTLEGLNASGRSPLGLQRDALCKAVGSTRVIPTRGPLTLTVPGAVAGWQALHERGGRYPWARLFEPALALARDGFAVGAITSRWWQRAADDLAREPALTGRLSAFAQTFLSDGRAPAPGAVVRNPGLARLFAVLQTEGAEAFYGAAPAHALVAAQRASDGHLALTDLEAHKVEWVTPLHTRYRGYEVSVLPPNGQGLAVLQMLNILENFSLADFAPDSPEWWHLFLEAKKLVFADRARYYADPSWSQLPIESLLSKAYAAERATSIDPRRARADQTPGDVWVPGGDTTYLTVADSRGCMVSLIQSLFHPFGSGIVVPEFGFALQSRGTGFALVDGHPNDYAPGKRPFHTIMPGFVRRDEVPYLSFGAVGGDMQPQAQVQVLANLIDFGCNVRAAGELPRLRHVGGANPNGTHDDALGVAHFEPQFAAATIAELARRGHVLREIDDPITGFVGAYQGILRDPAQGMYWGASDSRVDGCALGY